MSEQSEAPKRMSLDSWIKLGGLLAVIAGVAFGFWQYLDAAEKNFRKPYWEQQIKLYFEATSAAATLATTTNDRDRRLAEADFWRLYYGPLVVVEDTRVAKAMVEFGKCLNNTECDQPELKSRSLSLARAARTSIGESWALTLDDLQGVRP